MQMRDKQAAGQTIRGSRNDRKQADEMQASSRKTGRQERTAKQVKKRKAVGPCCMCLP
jgi:hypothetical protein